ncbi:MAG: HlyD family efflux transporter periplasmic adaptor subunit [Gammaproteobacteria bacterium]|nr:HlyD family efflux transporter periplasmic adaptor subunit [Gammaproteobacteria bacterium]
MEPDRKQALKKYLPAGVAVVAAALFWLVWTNLRGASVEQGLASGNGRIEATEIDIATKLAGRVDAILVAEGEFVKAGQTLARMESRTLQAQRAEAQARQQQALQGVAGAEAQVALRESDRQAVRAQVLQREVELDSARRRLARSETLAREGASSGQELDDDRARVRGAEATLAATRAQLKSAAAAVAAARSQVTASRSEVAAAEATVARIDADLTDSALKAPRDGRVQFLVAQPGEVLAGGGKVLNMVDLTDVSMSFFLPETIAGRIALGSDARIVLDAAPQFVIPAKVSFVASVAQFTPKTVETESERQKLMFRVKARIDPELLKQRLEQVKTGLPGIAWVKSEAGAAWPERLAVKVTP